MKRFAVVLSSFMVITFAHAASFDCARAKTRVEVTICKNHDLSRDDSKLGSIYKAVLAQYNAVQKKSLLEGERRWLKLRGVACPLMEPQADGYDFQSCLENVYKERIQELQDELVLQRQDISRGAESPPDFERILDEELNGPFNEAMRPGGNFDSPDNVNPKTCRQFYTYNAAGWKYGLDTIGYATYTDVMSTCAYRIFRARAYHVSADDAKKIDFGDITQYSTGLACLQSFNDDCQDSYDKGVHTFAEEAANKTIAIVRKISDKLPGSTLAIEKGQFQINGIHYYYSLSPVGDYTHRGRAEALLRMDYMAVGGTANGSFLAIAYFDPKTKAIRTVRISDHNLLHPLSAPQGGLPILIAQSHATQPAVAHNDVVIPGCLSSWNAIAMAGDIGELRTLVEKYCLIPRRAGGKLPISGGNNGPHVCARVWDILKEDRQLNNVRFMVTHNCPVFYRKGWISRRK